MSTLSTYQDLVAALAALPPRPPGTVRVFRGQTKDYENLTPSGLRRTPRNQAIWFAYSGMLYSSLLPELIEQTNGISAGGLQALGLWFGAVAQHYGPGSDFLDVTHSVDAALWFALNKTTVIQATGTIGPDGPPDPVRDHPTRDVLVRYDPWNEAGYIYVFDLPLWNGEGLPEPGMVVDLATAPPVFATSARMRAQSGCLINCRNADGTAADMRKLLVGGSPLAVQRPMSGAPGPVPVFDYRVADIYPSPARDSWFARFLSVPMTYSPEPAPPSLERSIPVTVYFDPGNQRYLEEVHYFDVALPLTLVHRAIPDFSRSEDADRPIAIALEAPLIFPYPKADSDAWHQGLLWSDVPDSCSLYEFGQAEPKGVLPLGNVLFEFSLLEEVGWERMVLHKAKISALRAVWLRRAGDEMHAAFISQEMPGGDLQRLGFLRLRYDAVSGRIVAILPNGSEPAPLEQFDSYAKAVFVGLMLLRYLSTSVKFEPTPLLTTQNEGEDGQLRYEMIVGTAPDAARLYRVQATAPNPDWYVLRDAKNPQEPFTHVTEREGEFQLESRRPFRDFPIADLVGGLAKQEAHG
jgi:FRG domain